MNMVNSQASLPLQVLNDNDIDNVSGGLPIVVAAYYAGAFIAGCAGGWTFGRAMWAN